MKTGEIDAESLKQSINLPDLAGRHTTLRPWTRSGEQAGPCPRRGCKAGKDGFHVHADGWFLCYTCHPRPGDVIEYVQWLGLAHDFKDACALLGGPRGVVAGEVERRMPATQAKVSLWKDAHWQRESCAELAEAQARLGRPEGEAGRKYLTARGLTFGTWQAWGLGWTSAWDGRLGKRRPAVVIPWQREQVTALKYRFAEDEPEGLRYSSKTGSECIAFGLQLAGSHRQTLWLVEGELNALSLWQALRERLCVNWDVVSFGAESGAASPVIQGLVARYHQVIVWADKGRRTEAILGALPGSFGLRSPQLGGVELDANELLQRGVLGAFAVEAWRRFDQDPAVVKKLEAELAAEDAGAVLQAV